MMNNRITWKILIIAVLITAAVILAGCPNPAGPGDLDTEEEIPEPEEEPVPVTGVSLDQSNADVDLTKSLQLTAAVEPADAAEPGVTWASADDGIASVDENGLVTGTGVGETTVTVTTTDGGFTASAEVTVGYVPTSGNVSSFQKISDTEGGFTGVLDDSDRFGNALTIIGDLNGDGTVDLIVGAYNDDDGGTDRGALWVLFMKSDGTVASYQKIGDIQGGFTGVLDDSDVFGKSVTSTGDLNGDGTADLVVGAYSDDDGGLNRGALWVLFMNSDGTVDSYQKISDTQGGFTGSLEDSDRFGGSVTVLGDLNGDGITELAVGAQGDDDGGSSRGAVWILFMNSAGMVDSYRKISDTQGGFTGTLDDFDLFGISLASIGDLDNDGVTDLAVGASQDEDGGANRGALWVLFLNSDGTVKAHQKISDTEGTFSGALLNGDIFGSSVTAPGDFNGDGITDLVIGASQDKDGGTQRGAIWMLFMNSEGTVSTYQKISDTQGSFTGSLSDFDQFGSSVVSPGDLNGDGVADLVVGAQNDNSGGTSRGAVWVLFMEPAS